MPPIDREPPVRPDARGAAVPDTAQPIADPQAAGGAAVPRPGEFDVDQCAARYQALVTADLTWRAHREGRAILQLGWYETEERLFGEMAQRRDEWLACLRRREAHGSRLV